MAQNAPVSIRKGRFGLPLEDAIYAVTAASAKTAGLERIGSIEAGKQADFLLLTPELPHIHITVLDAK